MRYGWFGFVWFFSSLTLASTLSFGVVPQQSPEELAKRWVPILESLSKSTGMDVEFRTAATIPEFEQRVLKGEYDVVYMNPYHYTLFHQNPGYIAFAKQKDQKLQGIIVVAKQSPIRSIQELNLHTLAFPSPAAFAATIIPQASLIQQSINIDSKYVSSHDSVYLNVANGFFIAGGGIKRTFDTAPKAVTNQLRILWESPSFTPHAFAYHPKLSHDQVVTLRAALLNLSQTEQGKLQLQAIGFTGIEAAQDSDWDDIRALNIQTLSHLLKE
ncbi:phosphate ABC transporter substrate-binding protein [Vibrio metoecus]|uniref:phosphate/phosphite/phosphonate ABC transporter substrate-binding protein n=1 Tax=Vibrio metoecus TaxID=1481663 RepID=UPI0001B998AF|nr:phosphate/phosphite/phosphonate ABC transporter substrate-binding protein [Vibrio metoecus]EEX66813.1 phosphonate ABC transporter phosphate-binding periplasmic component [Vibrio metoecus]KQB01149.1 phosphate ABC transporter substrate-binding protein [Vibrio metoecus]PAR58632.1 phosphate ABC transporter substrate-binding protein [Vibrio metoecus]PAR69569.1 phosphate ABC transporter substrate-binding protein [Vibrio metoecus]